MANPPSPPSMRLEVATEFDSEDNLWYADVLNLQGCHALGETEEDALKNVLEAIRDHIDFRIQNIKFPKFNFSGTGATGGPTMDLGDATTATHGGIREVVLS